LVDVVLIGVSFCWSFRLRVDHDDELPAGGSAGERLEALRCLVERQDLVDVGAERAALISPRSLLRVSRFGTAASSAPPADMTGRPASVPSRDRQ
jgi:hypothetical protein